MTSKVRLALTLSFFAALPACAMDDTGDDATADTTAAVIQTTGHWDTATELDEETYRGAQVASLNGVTYTVQVGDCGTITDCGFSYDQTSMNWRGRDGTGALVGSGGTSDQSANSKVSLAAFNGVLYMLHTGSDNSSATYLSKFYPSSHSWTQTRLADMSYGGPPSIIAFNDKLYLVGITSSSSMWYSTMDASGNFTPQQTIPGHTSASRVSLAVGFGKLWLAHRAGSSHNIAYGTFDGTTWTPATTIYGGVNGGALQGDEPVIAFTANVMHLVHRRPNDSFLWETTYNGCKWATSELSLGTQTSALEPSLAPGGPGLVLITEGRWNAGAYKLVRRTYTAPSVIHLPVCDIGVDP